MNTNTKATPTDRWHSKEPAGRDFQPARNWLLALFFAAFLYIQFVIPAFARDENNLNWLEEFRSSLESGLPQHQEYGDDLVRETAAFYQRLAKEPLRLPAPSNTFTAAPEKVAAAEANEPIATRALRYLGLPYRWGGESARGLDCSGLVKRVLAEFSLQVPHSAASQARLGRPVETASLQPGDILFFRTPGEQRISHVGIYLKAGKFLHSSRRAGQVIISSLDDPPYRRGFAGARRLLPEKKEFAYPTQKR